MMSINFKFEITKWLVIFKSHVLGMEILYNLHTQLPELGTRSIARSNFARVCPFVTCKLVSKNSFCAKNTLRSKSAQLSECPTLTTPVKHHKIRCIIRFRLMRPCGMTGRSLSMWPRRSEKMICLL